MDDLDRDPAQRKPWENPTPQMQACKGCGDPIDGLEMMQAVVNGELVRPLCSICYSLT